MLVPRHSALFRNDLHGDGFDSPFGKQLKSGFHDPLLLGRNVRKIARLSSHLLPRFLNGVIHYNYKPLHKLLQDIQHTFYINILSRV